MKSKMINCYDYTQLEVPEELVTLVAAATGIATNNITIQVKQKPVYEAKTESSFTDNISNYLMILLTVLIAGLLVFVIIKGTSPVDVTETEEKNMCSIELCIAKIFIFLKKIPVKLIVVDMLFM